MCLAVPMKLMERQDAQGVARMGGVQTEVRLDLVPDAAVGDYLIVHAGYAIQVLDEQEANARIEMLREVAALEIPDEPAEPSP